MAQFELETMGLDGVIPSEADFQAERGISRESAAMPRARSLGPLVKARAFGMTPPIRGIRIQPYQD